MTPATTQAVQLSVRAGLAAGLSAAVASAFDRQYALYAVIGSVLVTDPAPTQTRRLALRRLAGTLLGCALGVAIGVALPSDPLLIGVGVLATVLLCQLLRLRGAANISGYVCGLIILNSGDPLRYALARVAGTVVGLGVAVLVSFVPRLLRIEVREPAT